MEDRGQIKQKFSCMPEPQRSLITGWGLNHTTPHPHPTPTPPPPPPPPPPPHPPPPTPVHDMAIYNMGAVCIWKRMHVAYGIEYDIVDVILILTLQMCTLFRLYIYMCVCVMCWLNLCFCQVMPLKSFILYDLNLYIYMLVKSVSMLALCMKRLRSNYQPEQNYDRKMYHSR